MEKTEEYEEGLKIIYSKMPYPREIGAIPEEEWKRFLERQLRENGDLYIPEQVLRIIEQLAVNNDINGALKVYDSMQISLSDYDGITKLVEEHFPTMGNLNREILGKAYNEFMARANSKAALERKWYLYNKEENIESNNKESENTSIVQGDSIEQYEEGLKIIYSKMPYPREIGAIPEEDWYRFLESQLKENGDLYIPEQVLRIIEQLAVNNDINGALKVYDSMQISLSDYDGITKLVEEHFPTMGNLNREILGKAYNEFMARANSKASQERRYYSQKETKQLTTQQIGKATINAPTAAKVEAQQVENRENTKDNVREGEEVRDDN